MTSCILGWPIPAANKRLYDLRYFYIDEKGMGHCSCGVARQTLLSIYRQEKRLKTDFAELFSLIVKSDNQSVRGFLVEELCLEVITEKGIKPFSYADDKAPGGPLEREFFVGKPNWSGLILQDPQHTSHLYLPKVPNYANIDGAVLNLESRTSKVAHLYLIQVTIAMQHKGSDVLFYEKQWQEWVEGLTSEGWTVKSTFIWIDRKQPGGKCVERKTICLRRGDIEINPEYNVWWTGFAQLDSRFKQILL